MVELMKKMVSSFKRSHARIAALIAPNPAAGDRRPTPPLETPGHSWASLGQSLVESLLLSPRSLCAQGFVCAFQEFVSPVLYSGGSMVELMATSSKRAYAIPRFTAPRAPTPTAVHCRPAAPQETPRHSSVSVCVGSLGPGAHKVCLSPLTGMGFDSKCDFAPPPILLGLFCPWTWRCPHSCSSTAQPPLQVKFYLGQNEACSMETAPQIDRKSVV